MSAAQRRMWFVGELSAADDSYRVRSTYFLDGALDTGALIASVRRALARHEVLRSVYAVGPAGLTATITAPDRDAVAVWPGIDDLETPEHVNRDADRRASAGFDLSRGPMFRAGIATLGPDQYRLDLSAHHIVFDGISRLLLESDLSKLYADQIADRPCNLPAPKQYADYAEWEDHWLETPAASAALQYWTQTLAGHPGLLALGNPTSQDLSCKCSMEVSQQLGYAMSARLLEISRRNWTTPFVVGLAATAYMLGTTAGTDDVIIGVPYSGRDLPMCEEMIGFFVQTLPIRVRFHCNITFTELVHRTRDQVLDAIEHARAPFQDIIQALKLQRIPQQNPLFQHWFDFSSRRRNADGTTTADGRLRIPGVRTTRAIPKTSSAQFNTEMHLFQTDNEFELVLTYVSDLWTQQIASQYLDRFARVLRSALDEPDRHLSDIPALSPEGYLPTSTSPTDARQNGVTGSSPGALGGQLEGSDLPGDSVLSSALSKYHLTLTSAWEDVLGHRVPSINSDFFSVGGHSLLVVALLAKITQTFGIEVPIQALFESRTIADQALVVHDMLHNAVFDQSAEIGTSKRGVHRG